MQRFVCAGCQQIVHFENSQCTRCGLALALLPDNVVLTTLDRVAEQRRLFSALGLITINVAEADSPFREKTRLELLGGKRFEPAAYRPLPSADFAPVRGKVRPAAEPESFSVGGLVCHTLRDAALESRMAGDRGQR